MTSLLLPSMIERRSGFIGFIDSIGGHIAFPAAALYSATKFGLRGFAGALRREVTEHGIKVSIISPGFVSTGLTEEVREVVKKLHLPMISTERVARVIARTIERPRREIIIPSYYNAFTWLERNLPGVMDRVLSRILPILKEGGADEHANDGELKHDAKRFGLERLPTLLPPVEHMIEGKVCDHSAAGKVVSSKERIAQN